VRAQATSGAFPKSSRSDPSVTRHFAAQSHSLLDTACSMTAFRHVYVIFCNIRVHVTNAEEFCDFISYFCIMIRRFYFLFRPEVCHNRVI
jgi:hypothetical protein